MKKFAFITVLILTFCIFTFGQNSNCPTISVTGPTSTVQPGETMTFSANIDKNETDLSSISYQWSVDKGTIIEGQGTPNISINTEGLLDAVINASVEIQNLQNGCVNKASESGIVTPLCGLPLELDQFGKLPKKDEKIRLSVVIAELKTKPEMNAHIILYHPSKNKKSYDERVLRIKNLLIRDNKIPAERVNIISGGDVAEELTRIFLIPQGAQPPTP